MYVTLSGMMTAIKSKQPPKASSPILVTPSGMIALSVQVLPSIRIPLTTTSGFSFHLAASHGVSPKAFTPMLVTLSGMEISVRPAHP